jgi:DNA-binding beta-propeller fold protein YncE
MKLVLTDAVRKPALLRRAMVAAAAVAALGIGAPAAMAATATPATALGAFGGPGTADGQFTAPTHVAVEPTTGNVLVADSGNGRVQVFKPDTGASASFLTAFGSGTLTTPVGIAIDQTTGAVYVSDSGANEIFRFTSDGAATPTYTADPGFVSPALGAGAGEVGSFASALAIDPVSHDLLVADTGNKRVARFTSAGAADATFLGAASVSGALTIARDIAVSASGTIYVVDAEGDPFYDETLGGPAPSHLRRYTAVGAVVDELAGIDSPSAVGVDPTTGHVVAAGLSAYTEPARRVFTYADDGTLLAVSDLAPDPTTAPYSGQVRGLAVESGAPGRTYALGDYNVFGNPPTSYYGDVRVQVQRPTVVPGVDIGPTTAIGSTTAHMSGTVAPGGESTTVHLEYSLNGTDWTPAPDHTGITGTGEQTVGDTVTGLRPATQYSVRAIAANAFFSSTSSLGTFTTGVAAPVVETGAVSDITSTSATLTGRLTPLGSQSTFYFEYGDTAGYGLRVPANGGGIAGTGYAARNVTQAVEALAPGTLYHYRLVGTNAGGTTTGDDETFTTDAAGLPARGYEMVSPVDKQGVPADNRYTGTYARPDGNAVMYATRKSALPDAQSNPMIPRVLGTRSADGWANQTLDAPLTVLNPINDDLLFGTVAVARDLSWALVVSQRKLTADAVEGTWNLYRREPASAPLSAEHLTLVVSDDRLQGLPTSRGNYLQVGTSDDGRKLVFQDTHSDVMYEASVDAGLRTVSVLPDGTTVAAAGISPDLVDPHQVSVDGSRTYFTDGISSGGPLYMRENGTTVPISVSHRPGDPATPVPANFYGASADGRYVMFGAGGASPLTPDALVDPNVRTAYRYDVETDTMTYVASGLPVDPGTGVVAVPETGDIFFQSDANLTGSPPSPRYLYRAHGGASTLIAALDASVPGAPIDFRLVSPNGRYFAFVTDARLPGYDNDGGAACHALRVAVNPATTSTGCRELYLYDTRDGTLTCPSCRTDGRRPTGDVGFGQFSGSSSSLNRMFARSVLDDGTVFFDTPDALVSADSNGTRDVYSSRHGRVTLISRGSQAFVATFVEATPDGHDVFFVTADRLVGQDRDDTDDLYDARIGGGIAVQSPAPGPAACAGDQCREPASGPTTSPPQPSQTSSPVSGRSKPPQKPKISVLRSSFSAKTLTMTVQTSSRGRIRASGATITATSRTAAKAGTYTLKIPLTRKTRAARKARRRVKVAVKVSLTPPFAAPITTKLTRTLGK